MPIYGEELQREAGKLFSEREIIVGELRELSMEEFRNKVNYYISLLYVLNCMLDECNHDNSFNIGSKYSYKGKCNIYKSEIDELIHIISAKIKEYERYLINNFIIKARIFVQSLTNLFRYW